MRIFFSTLLIVSFISGARANPKNGMNTQSGQHDTLAVLWTSGDPEVAKKVCFMYTHNALKQDWFKSVILIVWGPSAKLLSQNDNLQEYIKTMQDDGIQIKACKACSDSYGVSEELSDLGIEVRYMGKPLTKYLKAGYSVLTF